MKSTKKITAFTQESKLKDSESDTSFSHDVGKLKKTLPPELKDADEKDIPQKYKNLWFVKKMDDRSVALREVVAQEFFRLLIPGHPKTRFVVEEKGNRIFVASKQVPGFRGIESVGLQTFNASIKSGAITGLGDVTVMSLLMNEIDLKNGNIGINDKRQIIKIDGDWCFARLSHSFRHKKYEITESVIKHLPFPDKYYAWNWLDAIKSGIAQPTTEIIDEQTSINPRFRTEVNNALLRTLILPNELINNFVKTYVEDEKYAQTLYEEIIQRKQQMEKAALSNADFQTHLKTETAKQHLEEYFKYLRDFKTTSKHFLLKTLDNAEKMMRERFSELTPQDLKVESKIIVTDNSVASQPKASQAQGETPPAAVGPVQTPQAQPILKPTLSPAKTNMSTLEIKVAITPQIIAASQHTLKPKTPPVVQPKPSGVLSTPTKKGAFTGFILGLLGAAAFITLRVLDVFTLGLSLPVTIPLSIAVLGVVGTLSGAGIGRIVQSNTTKPTIKSEPFSTLNTAKTTTVKDEKLERNISLQTQQLYVATQNHNTTVKDNAWNEDSKHSLGVVPTAELSYHTPGTKRQRGAL